MLEGGRYLQAPSSRAFPGWTAEEIHRALNEWEASLETVDALRRVAGALAAVEGTGPDDDPFLQRERAEGRAEGRIEAELDIVRAAVPAAFDARGLAVTRSAPGVAGRPRPCAGRRGADRDRLGMPGMPTTSCGAPRRR